MSNTAVPMTRLVAIISDRRRTRSTTSPAAGDNAAASHLIVSV
jgi:hypothetical protein